MSARRSEKTEAVSASVFLCGSRHMREIGKEEKKGRTCAAAQMCCRASPAFCLRVQDFFPCGGAPLQKSGRKNHSLSAGVSLFLVRRKVSSVMRIISSANAARYQGRKENPIRLPSSPNRGGMKVEPT